MSENQRCAIFYVSDGTAITAETVGRSLITQFTGIDFIEKRLPFINDVETARAAAEISRACSGVMGTSSPSSTWSPASSSSVLPLQKRSLSRSPATSPPTKDPDCKRRTAP